MCNGKEPVGPSGQGCGQSRAGLFVPAPHGWGLHADAKAAGWSPLKPHSHTRLAFDVAVSREPQFPSTAASPCVGSVSTPSQCGGQVPQGRSQQGRTQWEVGHLRSLPLELTRPHVQHVGFTEADLTSFPGSRGGQTGSR